MGWMNLAAVLLCFTVQSHPEAIERLGVPTPEERDRASDEILSQGIALVPALLAALDHQDPEIRGRVPGLLNSLGPSKWLPSHFNHPRALDFFHGAHRDILNEAGQSQLLKLTQLGGTTSTFHLDPRDDTLALFGIVLFRVGDLRKVRGEDLGFTGGNVVSREPENRPIRIQVIEGAIVAGFAGELCDEPLCRQLWRKILEDPADPQAACLLADLIDPAFEAMLILLMEKDDPMGAAAFEILTHYWAKTKTFNPTPKYFERLQKRLPTARWELIGPLAVLATKHTDRFLPVLQAGWQSSNRWWSYLALGTARVTSRREIYDRTMLDFLGSPLHDLQREAVLATLAVAPAAELPPEAVVRAAIRYNPPETFIQAFRSRKDERLGVELALQVPTHLGLPLHVLDLYADSSDVAAAFTAALPESVHWYYAHRVVDLLGKFSVGGHYRTVHSALRRFLRHEDAAAADRALRLHVAGGRADAVPEIEGLLRSTLSEFRRRGVEGVYALWLLSENDTALRGLLRDLLAPFVQREKDEDVARVAQRYHGVMTGKRDPVAPDERKPKLFGGSGCDVGTYETGWKPVIATPFPRPYWRE